jgi:ParB-like nuclease domain
MPQPKSEKPATDVIGQPASEFKRLGGALEFEANNPEPIENQPAETFLDQQIGTPEIAIAEIVIGERYRRDMGDIEGLAASIDDIGLIEPIAIDSTGLLLAGSRRLAAAKLLGWTKIAVTVISPKRSNGK